MAMQKLGFRLMLGAASAWALLACGGSQPEPPATPATPPAAEAAPAAAAPAEAAPASGKTVDVTFQAKSGSKLSGKGTLMELPEGVKVALALDGIPAGEHGAHVHEKGDCSAPDGASAGGHFNPASHPHALPTTDPRHL